MKKIYFSALGSVFTIATVLFVFQMKESNNRVQLTKSMRENIEALTQNESSPSYNCVWQSVTTYSTIEEERAHMSNGIDYVYHVKTSGEACRGLGLGTLCSNCHETIDGIEGPFITICNH